MKLLSGRSLFPVNNAKVLYYRSLIIKSNVESSYHAVTKPPTSTTETIKDIIYRDLRWGSSSRAVVNALGTPRYRIEALNDLQHHQVLFFKRQIVEQNTVVQCHFLENQLYFVHIDFTSALSNDLAFINDLIYEKYLIPVPADKQMNCIQDYNKNKLIISKNVTLSLTYISGLPSVVRSLEKQMQPRIAPTRRQYGYFEL